MKIFSQRIDLDLCAQRGCAPGEFLIRRRDDHRAKFRARTDTLQSVQRCRQLGIGDELLYLDSERCL